ncbi:MAG: hypothetical protein FWC92_01485 [Defluviitaleaceae bacterium]|nr:hypothetical protein [Defluviitaleaceae bacterium]
MKTTIVSFLIYTLIFLVVGVALYFFVFWRPNNNRVDQLNIDIEAARAELVRAVNRDESSPQLTHDIAQLAYELTQAQSDREHVERIWQYGYLDFLPISLDELDIRERINRIAILHSHSMNVYFHESIPFGAMSHNDDNPDGPADGIWLTPVSISFVASYEGLISILHGFAHEDIDNRIVEYSIDRHGDQLQINLRMDILTLTPHLNSYNGYFVEPDDSDIESETEAEAETE